MSTILVNNIARFPTILKAIERVIRGFSNTREIIDKIIIKVIKAKKNLNITVGI